MSQRLEATPENALLTVPKDRWRAHVQGRTHAVSPIIATILLLAITVVLAAVLYILVSGVFSPIDHSPRNPIAIAVTESWKGSCTAGTSALYEYTFGVDATTSPITTQQVGLEVVNSSNNIVPLGRAATPSTGTCPMAPTSGGHQWVAVLEGSSSPCLAFWDSTSGGTWSACSGGPHLPQTLNQGQTIVVIAGVDLSNGHMNGFSLTSTPVSLGGGIF